MRKPRPSKSVRDFLENLTVKKIFVQIRNRIRDLIVNPALPDSRKIGDYMNLAIYRNDIGEYRIIYQYDEKFVYFLLIGKRNDADVYRKLNRKIK